MNDNRRKNLKRALSMLESANQIISQAADQEQDSRGQSSGELAE